MQVNIPYMDAIGIGPYDLCKSFWTGFFWVAKTTCRCQSNPVPVPFGMYSITRCLTARVISTTAFKLFIYTFIWKVRRLLLVPSCSNDIILFFWKNVFVETWWSSGPEVFVEPIMMPRTDQTFVWTTSCQREAGHINSRRLEFRVSCFGGMRVRTCNNQLVMFGDWYVDERWWTFLQNPYAHMLHVCNIYLHSTSVDIQAFKGHGQIDEFISHSESNMAFVSNWWALLGWIRVLTKRQTIKERILLMERILQQLIGSLFHYLQSFFTSKAVQDFFHQQYVTCC